MARILGVDLPRDKKIKIALTYIYGVGDNLSAKVLKKAGVNGELDSDKLTNEDITKIRDAIVSMGIRVEGELKRVVTSNIKRLQDIKSYRGSRHKKGLPTRGQRTRKNARTRKGKNRPVGGLKRVLAKT